MPAQTNWVRFRLLLIAIGLQSLSMKIFMLQSPLCPRETGSPGRLSGDWLLIFFLDGLGSIPALLNSFYLFPVVEKDFLFLLLFVRAKRQVLLGSFSGVRGSNAGADKIIYQIFELCNFSKSGLFERAQVQMPMSPGSGFDARELLGLFLNVIERR